MLAGLFAGFAFGIAGNTFQTMLRNPLANPNVIGITSGSSAAAVFCIIILHTSGAIVSIASVIAGLATVVLIYILSRGKSFSIGRLILIGIGIQAMLDACNILSSAGWRRTRYSCSVQMAQWKPQWLSNARASTSVCYPFSSLRLSL